MNRFATTAPACLLAALVAGCTPPAPPAPPANTAPPTAPAVQQLKATMAPPMVKDMMATRGEQDAAKPAIKIVEPADGSTVEGTTVRVKLALSGDLKGYKPGKDPATGMGNHIHVILDNQPYEAYYNPDQPFELRNLSEGKHTLRVFPSRPWHESYKNEGAFQMATFTVKAPAGVQTAPPPDPAPEGKDMPASQAGDVDLKKPLLTYSRPKGEYKGAEADPVMIDFWLSNAKLQGEGGEYRVRYTVDNAEPGYIDKWEPTWLKGWTPGKHTVKLELVDKSGAVVDNGGYNVTSREITIAP